MRLLQFTGKQFHFFINHFSEEPSNRYDSSQHCCRGPHTAHHHLFEYSSDCIWYSTKWYLPRLMHVVTHLLFVATHQYPLALGLIYLKVFCISHEWNYLKQLYHARCWMNEYHDRDWGITIILHHYHHHHHQTPTNHHRSPAQLANLGLPLASRRNPGFCFHLRR